MTANEKIAKVMGWEKIGSMIYIKCEHRYVAVEFLKDIFLSELPAAKLLQAKMVHDGWSVFISHFAKDVKLSLTDPDGVAPGRIHCAAEIEKHPASGWPGTISAFGNTESETIVALFCKVYNIKED